MTTENAPSRPPFTYQDEIALVDYLVAHLERRLAGRHEPRMLRIVPSDHCHLGALGPRDPHVEAPEPLEPAETVENSDNPAASPVEVVGTARNSTTTRSTATTTDEISEPNASDIERVTAEQQGSTRDSTRRPPSSLGFEVIVQPGSSGLVELAVNVQFAIYTQHFPSFDEQREELGRQPDPNHPILQGAGLPPQAASSGRAAVSLTEAFVRRIVSVSGLVIRVDPARGTHRLTDGGAIQEALDAVLDEACADPSIWHQIQGFATVPVPALANANTFAQYLQSIATGPILRPPLQASLDVRVNRNVDGSVRARCYLCNDTPRDLVQRFRDQHHILADCQVEGVLVDGTLLPVELLPVPRDYQFDRSVWAVGHAASVVVASDRRAVRTEALARFAQPRRTTSQQPVARFADLVRDPFATLESIRVAMVDYANSWQETVLNQNTRSLSPEELEVCRADLGSFRDEEARFAAGIAALAADPRLRIAFDAMNRVFQRTSAGRYSTWHLFQIVFIVSQLPALAFRENLVTGEWPPGTSRNWEDALEWADVLWFPTGGGKTEAYLGLIVCAALYDRLRGKRLGVTAWLRFPLRMLSVQQLQRAAVVLWEAEQERLQLQGTESVNSDRISLGYFVGGSSTPNRVSSDDGRAGQWSFTRLQQDRELRDKLLLISNCPACRSVGSVQIVPDRATERIRHVCTRCNADLPVFVSDDEIYRFLPTVIVGTIDKMASIAYNAKFPMLWGGVSWRCPEAADHGYGIGDWCVSGCPRNPQRGGRARQRTAVTPYDPTPSFHVQDELHLLQQELGAFAGHYETLVRSCEVAVGRRPPKTIAATATIEGYDHQIRQVYGVSRARRFPTRGYDLLETFYTSAARDTDHPSSELRTARLYVAFRPPHLHAADAASLCTRLLHEELIRLYDNPYETAAWLPTARTDEEVRHLLYFYSTTLTYVGSKSRGVRIRQALDRDAGRLRPGNLRDLSTEFLSGDSTLATIAETVRRVENPPGWTEDGYLDATIATNVISHGVDVERFNLMVMDSIPEETADYIQASSRSGRRHVGLIVAVLASYSLRASSIYHRFTEYHQHLERLVSPVSVNRFAKFAAERTASGILIGLLLGRYGPLSGNARLYERNLAEQLLTPGTPSNLRLRVSREELRRAVEDAYALGRGIYPDGLERGMREVVEQQTDRFLFRVRGSREDRVADVMEPKPMTSLRDVDAGVRFRPEEDADWQELQWFNTHLQ